MTYTPKRVQRRRTKWGNPAIIGQRMPSPGHRQPFRGAAVRITITIDTDQYDDAGDEETDTPAPRQATGFQPNPETNQ